MRNLILSAALVTASLFGMTAQAADVPLEAGKTYVELATPVPVSEPGKIEVVELFWYGCPHCYAFEPTINPWVEKLPSDVNFRRIPAMFGGPWDAHGQLFLTLEAMGVEHKVHNAVFNAIQKEGKRLTKPDEMADFVATQGVDKDKFLATFNSFAIQGQIKQAKELAKKYGVQGVPTMIVNGKYRFDLGTTGGPEQTLNVADQLIAKERAAK
ncbi:Thiol:disulfide interchange protein DsbA precursor [Pseudomonas sp. 22 E 5]|uniref:Thiol:disulfide interchange protein n=1 Tax=Pseudomonas salomonii TaxID=191391 RepID=A0A1H3TG50_9PSED|nr:MULTISPECIES: thiol:disulfide interchange protein DsbA [Pseudomonas]CRM96050.1 Thiol:disulfide interchange protein DsbA precursor [Pseudomonas sp. 22 E 5]NWF11486.1 thiol:disulfide interchange protein DsbA/DsbL [Pseudomonas salomonii]PIB43236.1 thiol:disulfide interchange protein [Pseudomonas sp. 2822-15]CRM80507.1 Thiol:disulfide interchange protein DsbA precursor [Pseudomonas sp. 58 R 3]SDZ49204.1 Thiol:disulfide interchange protein DsbA [Pseudomonas salomonii]